MKFLADANIGKAIIAYLQSLGHDVFSATALPPKTADVDILQLASTEDRVVLTADKDFGELVFSLRRHCVGVVLLRIETAHERDRCDVLARYWTHVESSLPGYFVVVSDRGVRRTALPDDVSSRD
jgi:predicted nuclease of predicted toxin-antitoxin system